MDLLYANDARKGETVKKERERGEKMSGLYPGRLIYGVFSTHTTFLICQFTILAKYSWHTENGVNSGLKSR